MILCSYLLVLSGPAGLCHVYSGIVIRYYTQVFILIPSFILGNSRLHLLSILKGERKLKSLGRLCAIIALIYDLSYNYILTNNHYDAALNRTRDLIVRAMSESS